MIVLQWLGKVLWGGFSWILTLVIMIGIGTLLLRSQNWDHWILVRPPSLPEGLYVVSDADSLSVGIPVLLCIPGSGGAMALSRGYVTTTWMNRLRCAEDEAPMIKMLAALPGDHVLVEPHRVQIDQRSWIKVPMANEDSNGRQLKPALGNFQLTSDECYALNLWSEKSFDSRYFGPFPCPHGRIQTALPMDAHMAQAVDSLGKLLRGE